MLTCTLNEGGKLLQNDSGRDMHSLLIESKFFKIISTIQENTLV